MRFEKVILFLGVLPLQSQWVSIPRSEPACFQSFDSVSCDGVVKKLPTPLVGSPRVEHGALIGLTLPKLAPELETLRSIVNDTQPLLFAQLPIKDVRLISLPRGQKIVDAWWRAPFLVIQAEEQIWWIRPDEYKGPQKTQNTNWKMRFGHAVSVEHDRVLFVGTEHTLRSVSLPEGTDHWSIALPVESYQSIVLGQPLGPLKSLVVTTSQGTQTFWVNPQLGAWVHSAPNAPVSAVIEPPKFPCAEPPASGPFYQPLMSQGTPWCFDYLTLEWQRMTGPNTPMTPLWSDENTISFWNKWFPQNITTKGLVIRKLVSGKIFVGGYIDSKSREKLHWLMERVCSSDQCNLELHLRPLPETTARESF